MGPETFVHGCVFIALFPELLQARDESSALVVETYDFIGVGRHITIYDILFYRFEIVFDKFIIEHIYPLLINNNGKYVIAKRR